MMGGSSKFRRAMARLLAGAGLLLLVVGSLGLMAGTAEAAAPPPASGQVLSQALAAADAAPSPSLGHATSVTNGAYPTSVDGGLSLTSPPNPAWPTWAIVGGLALLVVTSVFLSVLAPRGRRQA